MENGSLYYKVTLSQCKGNIPRYNRIIPRYCGLIYMTSEPISHFAPGQTTPDIFVMHMVFPVGVSSESTCAYQWSINFFAHGSGRWDYGDDHLMPGPGDIVLVRPLTRHSWRVLTHKS